MDSEGAAPSATRLDAYLVRHGVVSSRRQARDLIALGLVLVNGRRPNKSCPIHAGDRVEAISLQSPALRPNPDMALEILYAGTMLVVVNKPGRVPCHPLSSGESDTLMNAVVARFPETALVPPDAFPAGAGIKSKPLEGLLVHRLDNGTSGAVMVARDVSALVRLREALRRGGVRRQYTALVEGSLTQPLELSAAIAHHPRNPRKMVAAESQDDRARLHARPALTRIVPLRRIGRFTLVTAIPATGSRHQIRVHLANAGYPIAGDVLYGANALSTLAAGRFFLHLSELAIEQSLCQDRDNAPPQGGIHARPSSDSGSGAIIVRAPLAADLTEMLSSLGA